MVGEAKRPILQTVLGLLAGKQGGPDTGQPGQVGHGDRTTGAVDDPDDVRLDRSGKGEPVKHGTDRSTDPTKRSVQSDRVDRLDRVDRSEAGYPSVTAGTYARPVDDGEIAWRVAAMRPQLPPRGPLLFLTARPGLPASATHCWSCGEPLLPGQQYRGTACARAVRQLLDEIREGVRSRT
jgi:hypothetical protein